MSTGPLTQLVARGMQDALLSSHKAYEMFELAIGVPNRINSISLRGSSAQTYYGDLVTLKHIIYKSDNISSVDEFKHLMKDDIFEIIIGGTTRCRYNMSLLMNLNEVQKIGCSFSIKIPHEYTIDNFILIGMYNATAKIETKNHERFHHMSFFIEYIYVDMPERVKLIQQTQNKYIQTIEQCGYDKFTSSHKQSTIHLIDNSSLTKGYFIEGDISKLKHMGIIINGHNRFTTYDEMSIALYCHKISDNLIYYSFNGQNNYKDMSLDSYIGAPNNYRIDTMKMFLDMDIIGEEICDVKIYSCSFEYLSYIDGWLVSTGKMPYIPPNRNNLHTQTPIISTNIHIWTTEEKDMNISRNDTCPISQEIIGSEYCTCLECNNNFDYNSLKQWIDRTPTCPLCKTQWTNKVKYIRNII
jgi:hypothetical protein